MREPKVYYIITCDICGATNNIDASPGWNEDAAAREFEKLGWRQATLDGCGAPRALCPMCMQKLAEWVKQRAVEGRRDGES